jgi:hypothetical protein
MQMQNKLVSLLLFNNEYAADIILKEMYDIVQVDSAIIYMTTILSKVNTRAVVLGSSIHMITAAKHYATTNKGKSDIHAENKNGNTNLWIVLYSAL